jgi:hypothetical protein
MACRPFSLMNGKNFPVLRREIYVTSSVEQLSLQMNASGDQTALSLTMVSQ